MITLETTVTHTEKKMLKLKTPAFWKNPTTAFNEYRAVIDERTYVSIRQLELNGEILQLENSNVNNRGEDIFKAQSEWDIITEEEFMEKYNAAVESISLTPKISV